MFTTQILNGQVSTHGVYVGDLSSTQTTVLIIAGIAAFVGIMGLFLSELRRDVTLSRTRLRAIPLSILCLSFAVGVGYFAYSNQTMLERVNDGYGVVNTINSMPGEGNTKIIDTVIFNPGFVKHDVIMTQQGGVVTLSYIDPTSADGKLIYIPLDK